MTNLLRANCDLLQQGIDLLSRHDDESYRKSDASTYGSGIGVHFRHVLDHYKSFIAGYDKGLIDYDHRIRDTEMETDLEVSIREMDSVRIALAGLVLENGVAVDVMVSASTTGADLRSRSSLGRELQFLVSHTVHHYALIAIASRILGIFPNPSFGVAPSTLKYLQTVER